MKRKNTGTLTVIALAAAGAVVLLLSHAVAVEAAYPVERAAALFSRRVWPRVAGVFRGAAANAENVRLRREVAALSLLAGDVGRLEDENARLRRALGYVAKAPERWLAAGVLSAGGGAAGVKRTLRVDKGSLAGVAPGAVVSVPEGLVGQVTNVTAHTSEVLLVTDPALRVACEIEVEGAAALRGILSGSDGEFLVLRHLRGAAEGVPPRSRVLTSGLGGVFPRGIEVGTFLQAGRMGSGAVAEVLPAVDFSTLRDVFIRREK